MKGGLETDFIHWLQKKAGGAGGELIGDDAAMLELGGEWAVTVDQQIEGTHFLPGLDPALLARRVLAVNLSDLAAVGALPILALATLAVPRSFPHNRYSAALIAACRRHGMQLIGGDVAAAPAVVLTLTLLGRKRPRGRWLTRSKARPGDGLFCGASLGESAAGRHLLARGAAISGGRVALPPGFPRSPALERAARRAVVRHLCPSPQLELSAWLARQRRVAAIDVSDGFGLDLSRLLDASDAGALVERAALPEPPRLAELAHFLGVALDELVFGGGEDYALLFTLPPGSQPPADLGCTKVGTIERQGTRLICRDGVLRVLPRRGFDHLAGGDGSDHPSRLG